MTAIQRSAPSGRREPSHAGQAAPAAEGLHWHQLHPDEVLRVRWLLHYLAEPNES